MPTRRLKGLPILVVEDEVLIAFDIAMQIEEAGGVVVGPAGTVSKALSLIEQREPSAAILDVCLGREDVGEVATALTTRGIPFLFHTGHADEILLAQWSTAPVVRKPSSPDRLLSVLARLIP